MKNHPEMSEEANLRARMYADSIASSNLIPAVSRTPTANDDATQETKEVLC